MSDITVRPQITWGDLIHEDDPDVGTLSVDGEAYRYMRLDCHETTSSDIRQEIELSSLLRRSLARKKTCRKEVDLCRGLCFLDYVGYFQRGPSYYVIWRHPGHTLEHCLTHGLDTWTEEGVLETVNTLRRTLSSLHSYGIFYSGIRTTDVVITWIPSQHARVPRARLLDPGVSCFRQLSQALCTRCKTCQATHEPGSYTLPQAAVEQRCACESAEGDIVSLAYLTLEMFYVYHTKQALVQTMRGPVINAVNRGISSFDSREWRDKHAVALGEIEKRFLSFVSPGECRRVVADSFASIREDLCAGAVKSSQHE